MMQSKPSRGATGKSSTVRLSLLSNRCPVADVEEEQLVLKLKMTAGIAGIVATGRTSANLVDVVMVTEEAGEEAVREDVGADHRK